MHARANQVSQSDLHESAADPELVAKAATNRAADPAANGANPEPMIDQQKLRAVLDQLNGHLIGKEREVRLALAGVIARGHLLIEDVPGVGKTTLAHVLAVTLGLPWQRIQFTSDLLPGDITGISIFNTTTQAFNFQPGPVFTSVLLADEINRAPPRAQSALLEAMEERQVTVDANTYPLEDHFFVIATQNPTDQLGVYPLPESQLDRFLIGMELGYPDATTERALLRSGDRRHAVTALQPVVDGDTLLQWSRCAAGLPVSELLLDYVQALLAETRVSGAGLSPRAGLHLLTLARAWAAIHGRAMVLPEDVQAVFAPVAGHRLTGSVREGAPLCQQILDRVAVD